MTKYYIIQTFLFNEDEYLLVGDPIPDKDAALPCRNASWMNSQVNVFPKKLPVRLSRKEKRNSRCLHA